ncbi:hypothetical protein DPMN_137424 [Dreissena polymorpha]|uniref:Uncharacterized protein n=1 Tax=Dreissena polymorpha TaxID=45954 RepID=A0A9D4JDM5_DREPO|nr:hypothetical protein DPMN_137424 [Dreissena polymorpha]
MFITVRGQQITEIPWVRLAGSSLGSLLYGSDWLALHLAPLLSWVRLPGSSLSAVDMDSERTKVKPVDCI